MGQNGTRSNSKTRTESLLEVFFEAVPDATLLLDQDGTIILVNHQAELMFGYTRAELVGQPIELLVPERFGEHQQHRLTYHRKPRTRAMGVGLELFAVRKDGSEFPVDIMLNPFIDAKPNQVIAVIRNISRYLHERHQAESEILEVQHRLLDSQEAERQRLAQDLHDGPLQELHSLDFGLVALSRQFSEGQHQAQLMEMRLALQKVSRQLRTLCQDLRPPSLPFFGLSAVIRSCAENFQQQHPDLQIALNIVNDEQRLPERIRLALYRICQQTLKNVAQHAAATHVHISLQLDADQVVMAIEDNGKGFMVPKSWLELARQGHYGLIGCRERADAIGGRFEVISALGGGVKAQVLVPLTATTVDEV
jgi:PAS domain S-box-containing protein